MTVTFVSTVTVARLLSPHEFGLATMSIVLLSFAAIFRDFGLTNAVLRKGVVSQAELSMIFWFNTAMTIVLSLLIAATAPLAARFFGEPAVFEVILVSLIAFLLSGLSAQHQALVNRELRFSVVAVADIVAVVAGFATTLSVALVTRDVRAIVYGNLVQTMCSAVIYVGASRWVPGRPRRHEEFGDLLRFGANSSIYSISVFVSNNAAAVLIGHFLGTSALGQYNRAQALYSLPHANLIQPITQAVMPLLTRLRPHPEEYREAYLGLVRKLCVFLMPLSVVLTFAAVPLVEALLGPGWHIAGLVFAALSPAMLAVGFSYAVADLFVTQNRSAELRRQGLVDLVIRVSGIAIGVRFGVVGAAVGFTVSSVIVGVLRVWLAGRSGPVGTADQFRAATAGSPLAVGSGLGLRRRLGAAADARRRRRRGAAAVGRRAVGALRRPRRAGLAARAARTGRPLRVRPAGGADPSPAPTRHRARPPRRRRRAVGARRAPRRCRRRAVCIARSDARQPRTVVDAPLFGRSGILASATNRDNAAC
ncbi:MAG: lipopolysaccharide biosynthesis protein [Comamonadaceae bacterium]|nr:lipopolysaccharide biosynthesis protein [Comamonadaceae bacterium]